MSSNPFITVEEAILRVQAGQMVILVDDEDRENEGDLVIAAEFATPDAINFMSRFARGLICLSLEGEYVDRLQLPMMARDNRSPYRTAFTVSIEAATGVSTGISAYDRAHTIAVAIDSASTPADIISPGHMFPLRAHPEGVLARRGQTEGSVDLMKLAGLKGAAAICEVINDDGTMSRRDQLAVFAREHNIGILTIDNLAEYRIRHETLIDTVAQSRLPLGDYGNFTMTVFNNCIDHAEHFALTSAVLPGAEPLVRIHSECITGDVFGSTKCDCGAQLDASMQAIAAEGGILIYLRQEGRGIGLANKLKAYALQEQGFDTVEANQHLGLPVDSRSYAVAAQILRYFNHTNVRLLTNNPQKITALQKYGIEVAARVALTMPITCENYNYLKTKREKLGHLLDLEKV